MRILVNGCAGRMGLTLVRLISADPALEIHGGLEGPEHADMGADLGLLAGLPENGLPVRSDALDLINGADAVIDFSTPAASLEMAGLCAQARIVHIIGTTGFSAEDEAARRGRAPCNLVKSGNMSLGVNLLGALVRQTAAALGEDWDIEILDMHHRHKVDAPSGTALLLGEEAAKGRSVNLAEKRDSGRDGMTGARKAGDIGFAVLRGGSVIGHHDAVLPAKAKALF